MSRKALILYISQYSGHYQAASAIDEALKETYQGIQTQMINAFDYTNPVLGKVINKTYIQLIKKKPHVWGSMYDNPNVLRKTKRAREALHKYNKSKIKKLIEAFSPDAVFCTQAFPCGMIADYKRVSGKDVQLIAVLTDHAPHSYWLFDEVDYYVVPAEKTADMLQQKGVSREKIKVYGIPVDSGFRREQDKLRIRDEYDIYSDKPTVLVMGGSQGLGAMEDVVRSFVADEKHDYQVLVVTGTNKRLYSRLMKIVPKEQKSVRILPYIEKIEDLMEVSDIVITKAGGVTTAEALAKKLPILIVNPIPGQERMNTEFLVEEGAAVEVGEHGSIRDVIDGLFSSAGRLEKMKQNAGRLARPDSALRIAGLAG